MIADFYETFDESPDKGSDIPQEVLDILSQELPSTFAYYKIKMESILQDQNRNIYQNL